MEYIFYYFYFLNVWVMMSMGEGIAKIKGAYDEVVPKLSPAFWGTMFPHSTGFIPPSCKDDEANAILNLKIGTSCGATWMTLYFFWSIITCTTFLKLNKILTLCKFHIY